MNDIFIAIIVALILLIIGYVFQTKTEIKNENNKNIVKSRLDWLQNLKDNFSSYNENLNSILKLKNPENEEFKQLYLELENNVNKIEQEFKPYSYDIKYEAFKLKGQGETEEIPDILSYIEAKEDFKAVNNQIETTSKTEINLELFLILILNEVNARMKPHSDHSTAGIQKHSDVDYRKLWSQLESYQELLLELQKLIIKIEWERIKKDSDSSYKELNLDDLIKGNINKIAKSFFPKNHEQDASKDKENEGESERSAVNKLIASDYNLIEIKKDSVFYKLAEAINKIYNEDKMVDYMTTSTGQRYIFTTVKDASHPNGKLFGNKKELYLPLKEIDGELFMSKEDSEKTVYVETNFSGTYAKNLSELMKTKAGIKIGVNK